MKDHPNTLLVCRCYDGFRAGDLDRLHELLSSDVVWHEPGRSPIAGDYVGPAAVLAFLNALQQLSEETLSVELIDVMVNAERAVAVQRLTAHVGDREFDEVDAVDFEIHNHRVTEVSVYQQDGYAFDEFWSHAAKVHPDVLTAPTR
jgi:ketosteroid isomerase-like protein